MAKLIMFVILAAGVWLGIKTDRFLLQERCSDAGGTIADNGICVGVPAL
ncbi:MAG: hypothetical protein V3U96_07580 [Paracoccaceae bacterium]